VVVCKCDLGTGAAVMVISAVLIMMQ